jgi:hypothetical protein
MVIERLLIGVGIGLIPNKLFFEIWVRNTEVIST